MFNSKNFQREIFVEVGSFDNYKPLAIMLWYETHLQGIIAMPNLTI